MAERDQRKEPSQKKEILERPDNWDEMVKKYQEREDEQIKRVLEKRNVASLDELKNLAKQTLLDRAARGFKEHEPLKSHTILVEPKSAEIISLRQKLNEEIKALAKSIFQQAVQLNIPKEALKGRISVGAPTADFAEAGRT